MSYNLSDLDKALNFRLESDVDLHKVLVSFLKNWNRTLKPLNNVDASFLQHGLFDSYESSPRSMRAINVLFNLQRLLWSTNDYKKFTKSDIKLLAEKFPAGYYFLFNRNAADAYQRKRSALTFPHFQRALNHSSGQLNRALRERVYELYLKETKQAPEPEWHHREI